MLVPMRMPVSGTPGQAILFDLPYVTSICPVLITCTILPMADDSAVITR